MQTTRNLKKNIIHTLTRLTLGITLSVSAVAALAAPPVTNYEYDANGNMTKITDGLGNATIQQYDALNRLIKQQQPNPTAAGQLGQINMQYNAIDQMTAVTDPRNLTTSYGYNALNDQLSSTSPDTGATINTYDDAGNLKTKQDAKGQITTYNYDALNRLIQITYADNQTVTYSYDQGINGIGRLYQITDATGTTRYDYDLNGRITDETRDLNGFAYKVSYLYNTQGQRTEMRYPTGLVVTYTRDSLGRISSISSVKDGQAQVIANNISYLPFGGIQSFSYGNGRLFTRSYDSDYRINSYSLGNKTITLGYDAASRLTSYSNPTNAVENLVYDYDNLDRLTRVIDTASTKLYDYDLTGNRTAQTFTTNTYANTIAPNSNRMTATAGPIAKTNSIDANGSITDDGTKQYNYDARGRMTQAITPQGTASYGINALGQRVTKTLNGETTLYHYDINGQLIAETNDQGIVKEETIYLGSMPIAVIK